MSPTHDASTGIRQIGEEYVRQIVDLSPGQRKRYLGWSVALRPVRGSVQDEELLQSDFEASLEAHLAAGSFRAVIVLDEAPPELISLVGYLCNRSATPSTGLTNAGEFVD